MNNAGDFNNTYNYLIDGAGLITDNVALIKGLHKSFVKFELPLHIKKNKIDVIYFHQDMVQINFKDSTNPQLSYCVRQIQKAIRGII